MMKFCFSQRLAVFVVLITLVFGTHTISLLAQSRRQPPTSDQKKNKRPPQGQETGEKEQEPLPTDIAGKDTETIKVTTSLVNVDAVVRSEEHTSELQSLAYLVCRLLLEKKNNKKTYIKLRNNR